jgi:polyphosphate glucokinase
MRTLCIDIGGTGLKALIVDGKGKPLTERVRVETPRPATPKAVVDELVKLVKTVGKYDRVSVGFPGVVAEGIVRSAPNLDGKWAGFPLADALAKKLGKKVRALNDAGVQGYGVIEGLGVEMVITLGTGFGTGLYLDGRLGPHLELSHHPFRKGETYDEQLGNAARKDVGNKKWNKRVRRAVRTLRMLTNFDHLYIGGGNAKKIDFDLDPDVTIVDNSAGLAGGVALWRD